jgi:hypothetical protein
MVEALGKTVRRDCCRIEIGRADFAVQGRGAASGGSFRIAADRIAVVRESRVHR